LLAVVNAAHVTLKPEQIYLGRRLPSSLGSRSGRYFQLMLTLHLPLHARRPASTTPCFVFACRDCLRTSRLPGGTGASLHAFICCCSMTRPKHQALSTLRLVDPEKPGHIEGGRSRSTSRTCTLGVSSMIRCPPVFGGHFMHHSIRAPHVRIWPGGDGATIVPTGTVFPVSGLSRQARLPR